MQAPTQGKRAGHANFWKKLSQAGASTTGLSRKLPLELHGGDGWRDNWRFFFGLYEDDPRLEVSHPQLHASAELAVYRALVGVTGTIHGRTSTMWSRQTICLSKMSEGWLMFHNHISVPVDLATGQALVTLSPERPAPGPVAGT